MKESEWVNKLVYFEIKWIFTAFDYSYNVMINETHLEIYWPERNRFLEIMNFHACHEER